MAKVRLAKAVTRWPRWSGDHTLDGQRICGATPHELLLICDRCGEAGWYVRQDRKVYYHMCPGRRASLRMREGNQAEYQAARAAREDRT